LPARSADGDYFNAMSAPQLTDANTSSEWFRTVAEPGATEKPRLSSQPSIPTDLRRKRFVRLVTYTMGGLVVFTLLGVASFSMRQQSMQSALAAPPALPADGVVPAAPVPATTPEAVAAEAASPTPVSNVPTQPDPTRARAVAPTHVAVKSAPRPRSSQKPARRSPFLAAR